MKKTKDAHNKAIDEFSKALKQRSLTDLIVDKITQQWKSIKTAFIKMNCEKSGYIEKDELKVILQNWGFYLDDEKFDEVYSAFDRDKDGIINYADFKYAIGYRIQPEEYLYFRQDNPNTINLNPKEQKN